MRYRLTSWFESVVYRAGEMRLSQAAPARSPAALVALLLVLAMLPAVFATSVVAETRKSTESTIDKANTQWTGTYDKAFGSKAERSATSFVVTNAAIKWGTHGACGFRDVIKTESQFAFEINSNARCGWSVGNVVVMDLVSRHIPLAVDVYVYRNLNEFSREIARTHRQRKNFIFYAAYVKRQ